MATRTMSTAERAARDALKPYVKAKHMNQHQANKVIKEGGLNVVETSVRSRLKGENPEGQLIYFVMKLTPAQNAYNATENPVLRVIKRKELLGWEMFLAVYKAVRAEYLTPEQIAEEDAEAPLFAAALEVLTEEAAAARARAGKPCRYIAAAA